jgi:hypothetical protein
MEKFDSEGGDSGTWCVSEGFYESRDSPHGKAEVGKLTVYVWLENN